MSDERDAELTWTRRQLDEVAAENVRLTDSTSRIQRELEVRRRGFTLLAGLGRALGAHMELKPALAAVLPTVEVGLQVQRVLALEPDGDAFVPFAWTGYRAHEADLIAAARIPLPARVADEGVLLGRDSPPEEWHEPARDALGIRTFVAAPVGTSGTVLLAGREGTDLLGLRLVKADIDALATAGELVAAAVQNTQVAALAEVRRFLPPAVAEEIMSGRMVGEQGYERRKITLLAADMVGFTRLADSLPPERLAKLLNGYLREMTALAHAHGGTVGSLAGDGVLVIFGAPEAVPARQHAWAAVQAAFAMRARVAAVAREGNDPEVQIRVGINTGTCAVGVFGSASQRTYTAIGLPVNLAARLEAAATPGQVLASETTVALVAERVAVQPRGELTLKGFASPVTAFAIDAA